jgi:dynein heavy chain
VADVALQLRKNIEEFMEFVPLIKCVCSEAMTEEDWREIQEVTKQPGLEREDVTVEKIKQFEFKKYFEEIDEITMRAEKKFSLAKKLKLMKEEMKLFTLTLFPYKGKTFVLKAYDEVNAKLDDQIVNTQAMLGSQFMKGKLRNETKSWETKLNNMSELIEEISKCQKTWMYLEPIFASDDIHKQMPTEGAWFRDVDNLWKTTMDAIDNDPGIIDLVERENIKTAFEDSNKKLDRIQKSLNEYLEEKRLIFPRFYFLANEDLLMLLAQTKEPRAVQPHMDKCFEGIYRVMFSDRDEVYGLISAEGEEVELDKRIDVNEGDKKGNVEKWMLEIESIMRRSLKGICKESLLSYHSTPRTTWVRQWPGQIVLAVNSIHWTTDVEIAIKEYGKDGLESYKDKCNKQIDDIVQLVRTDLNVQERTTLKALVVIDVHARDVIQELIDKDIRNIADFDWTAQLRYYWDAKDDLKVKMVTAEIDYAYEYLGNSLRLVITPLTDRCYRTLLGAKYLNYGGAPEGPAGTGKTESVKDLAKAIAVQCVVFNCSDGLDYLAMAKFFKGLAASGAWCCFDEFNRIDLEVLSVIA